MNNIYNRSNPEDLVHLYDRLIKQGQEAKFREIDFLNLTAYLESEYSTSDALEAVNCGLLKFKFSSRLYTRKAQLHINQGQQDLAFDALDRAEIFGQSFIKTDIIRAQVHLSSGNPAEALKTLTELKYGYHTTPTQLSEILYVEALAYELEDEYGRMYTCLKEAVELNPFNDEALQKLYIAVEISRMHEESVLLHTKVLDENPYSHTAWFNLAQAYYFLMEYEEALDAFEYSFITNERFEPAYKEYIEVCFILRLYDKALSAMKDANHLFENDEDFLLKTGQCYEYLGDTEKARVYYYRALGLNKWADEVYFHIGECYAKEGQYESSIHFYKQAIKLDELREDYLMALAKTYRQLRRYQKALPLFQKATELGPELCENWAEYGKFLLHLDGFDEALEVIEDGMEHSFGAQLFYCKAAILFKLDKHKTALENMGKGLKENFLEHQYFFECLPDYENDLSIKAIINYYAGEPGNQI